jgi:predicted transcriptional regulator
MASMNFSVPDDVKDAFNAAFAGQNKSAIVAQLMRDAVQRVQRRQAHVSAIERILARHDQAPVITEAEFFAARDADRP